MPPSILETIRELVRQGRYDVTDHAWDEMADDNLLLVDVETAILSGTIVRQDRGDPRGTIYVIEGHGTDQTTRVGVAVRINKRKNVLIITAYEQ